MSTADERLHDMIVRRFDRIEDLLEGLRRTKVDYRSFDEFKAETENELKELKRDMEELKEAAITPDQVSQMVGSKLQESDARGITAKERYTRYAVAVVSVLTFILIVYDRVRVASGG